MKMANMDSAFDFMFTNPKNDRGVSNVCMLCQMMGTSVLSVRFEVDVSLLLAPAGADERGPKALFL